MENCYTPYGQKVYFIGYFPHVSTWRNKHKNGYIQPIDVLLVLFVYDRKYDEIYHQQTQNKQWGYHRAYASNVFLRFLTTNLRPSCFIL